MRFLDWEGFQPTVIMSDCASSWHIPVGRGNNYLSIPQSATDLIMIMTFSAAAYSKTCRKSFVLGQLQNLGAHHTGSGPSLYVVWTKVTTCSLYCMLKAKRFSSYGGDRGKFAANEFSLMENSEFNGVACGGAVQCTAYILMTSALFSWFSFSDLLTWFSFNSYCMSLIEGSREREPHSGRITNLKRKCATQQAGLWPLQK